MDGDDGLLFLINGGVVHDSCREMFAFIHKD